MYQASEQHPLSASLPPIGEDVFASMWRMFVQIGKFWNNMDDPAPYKTQLYTFMVNRISLDPTYHHYYILAKQVTDQLIDKLGEDAAYAFLFTDPSATTASTSPLALTHRYVSNEFIAWQLALGGFKAWGALNYCGYIGGAYIPGQAVPYRTSENQS